ncbi:hypothetical protein CEUSTIGMA_g181.t1 [Chlamydomonas eustigma]|uniref:Uncharacterized protein n=1 Tax=Chlamydomonas eustigma TaxID=1157962 RepID=A0A250WPF5_9CHLO|nr:hypothetical protein CEUSTIGMA_g181.t1 [Chlamydomonas eustigma]|eukprot:GAX72725.1 hypothetical protein CEUSTIGMA_g181.t1 [Chlamydomonas eustigma]
MSENVKVTAVEAPIGQSDVNHVGILLWSSITLSRLWVIRSQVSQRRLATWACLKQDNIFQAGAQPLPTCRSSLPICDSTYASGQKSDVAGSPALFWQGEKSSSILPFESKVEITPSGYSEAAAKHMFSSSFQRHEEEAALPYLKTMEDTTSESPSKSDCTGTRYWACHTLALPDTERAPCQQGATVSPIVLKGKLDATMQG